MFSSSLLLNESLLHRYGRIWKIALDKGTGTAPSPNRQGASAGDELDALMRYAPRPTLLAGGIRWGSVVVRQLDNQVFYCLSVPWIRSFTAQPEGIGNHGA